MATTLPTVDLSDLVEVENLPRKVRTVEPAKSPYQALIQGSLDQGKAEGKPAGEGKVKAFPGTYSLTAKDGSKTSDFTAITRELGRAARQMNLRVKTRKIVAKDNADMVTIVFQTFRDDKPVAQTSNGDSKAEKPADAPAAVKPATAPTAKPATQVPAQRTAAPAGR